MRVFEVMTAAVQTAPPTMSAAQARELMRRKRCHHLVVTHGRGVAGILSERDFKLSAAAAGTAGPAVADLMTTPVVTVAPNDTIRSVANLMRGRTIGCVPVVERGKLVGIVTVSDLLNTLGGGVDRPAAKSRRTLNFRVPHRKTRRVAW